jgi:hypothetical protein
LIEKYRFLASDFQKEEQKEMVILSIISQSFFQPFSIEDNLLVILTALTSGSGIGFNRAMLFLAEGEKLRGEIWLGPSSAEEANFIWEVLSTPGIGYIEIIEHNRALVSRGADSLSQRIKPLVYSLNRQDLQIPALAAARREVMLVREARNEAAVDRPFLDILGVDEFLCIPLFSRDEVLGAVVLDNAITRRPINFSDIKLASLCGLIAGNYVSTASLHKKMIEMERMAALGEMAMFITHQLRNPVAAIGGFTDQLLKSPNDEARQRRNLEIIRKEIKRLDDVLYRLAHFLKVDMKNELVPFDLPPVLRSVLRSPDIRSKSDGYEILVRFEEPFPKILGDPTYIGEALRNLLDNALDATPKGGQITILGHAEGKSQAAVEVRDTGRGMTPAVREKIFQPFFSTKEKGMGLGLLYVKRVMDSCGGKIEVESEAGKGTVFRLSFKSAEEERMEA